MIGNGLSKGVKCSDTSTKCSRVPRAPMVPSPCKAPGPWRKVFSFLIWSFAISQPVRTIDLTKHPSEGKESKEIGRHRPRQGHFMTFWCSMDRTLRCLFPRLMGSKQILLFGWLKDQPPRGWGSSPLYEAFGRFGSKPIPFLGMNINNYQQTSGEQ